MTASRWLQTKLLMLSWIIALGIGALVLILLIGSHSANWDRSKATNENLLVTVGHLLERTLDSGDRGLRHSKFVLERGRPVDPVALFAGMPENGYGIQIVLDDQGRVIAASNPPPPGDWVFADRPYFRFHQHQDNGELFLSEPFVSGYDGRVSVALSRRWNREDGSFGGVVVQTLKLSVLQKLFSVLELGKDSGINIIHRSGTVLVRFPYTDEFVGKSLSGTANFERFAQEKSGSFVGVAALDRVERLYVFKSLERYPLIINVAQATKTFMGPWQRMASVLIAVTLLLMAACVALARVAERGIQAHRRTAHRLAQAERELRTIVDSIPVLVAYWDKNLINRMSNIAHQQWFGLKPEEILGRHIKDVVGEQPFMESRRHFETALAGAVHSFERPLTDANGTLRHIVVTLVPDWEAGVVKGLFVLAADVTDIKETEMALFQQKERFRVILQSINDGVITSDPEGRVIYLNPAAEAMTGWPVEVARGRSVEEVMRVKAPDGSELAQCPLRQILERKASYTSKVEVLLESRDGGTMHIEKSAAPILDADDNLLGAVLVFHDSGPARAMASKMSHLAQHDALTGLPNRRRLDSVGHSALVQAKREGHRLAVLYLDLDGFKQVNDVHGHAVGDELLVAVTKRLAARVRSSDGIYRQGGDEFIVLMPRVQDPDEVEQLAKRLIESCQTPVGIGGRQFMVTLSVGISLYPDNADGLAELIQRADAAMYEAKSSGRNCYARYRASKGASDADNT